MEITTAICLLVLAIILTRAYCGSETESFEDYYRLSLTMAWILVAVGSGFLVYWAIDFLGIRNPTSPLPFYFQLLIIPVFLVWYLVTSMIFVSFALFKNNGRINGMDEYGLILYLIFGLVAGLVVGGILGIIATGIFKYDNMRVATAIFVLTTMAISLIALVISIVKGLKQEKISSIYRQSRSR